MNCCANARDNAGIAARVRRGRQSGAALVEYSAVTFFVIAALFVPIPELGMSVVDYLLQAMKAFQANSTYLLSLP